MKFEIRRGRDRQFYAHLKARNGEIVAQSEGYVRRAGAINWIRLVRKAAAEALAVKTLGVSAKADK